LAEILHYFVGQGGTGNAGHLHPLHPLVRQNNVILLLSCLVIAEFNGDGRTFSELQK